MKTTKGQVRSGFTLVELLVVISIIVVLAGLAVPTAMKALGKAEQVKGINNVKQIKNYLELFAGDYDGEYPSDDTAQEILELNDDNLGGGSSSGGRSSLERASLDGGRKLGGSNRRSRNDGSSASSGSSDQPSNYYFQQLIDSGTMDNEEVLFLKAFKKAYRLRKPNNDKQIDQGECVWGYTKNLQQTSSSNIPVVFDSPVSGGDSPKFSKNIWDGKTIMVTIDLSLIHI